MISSMCGPHGIEQRAVDTSGNKYYRITHKVSIDITGFSHEVDNASVRRYLTYMKTTISTKGQIVLPAEFRKEDDIEPGEEFEIERIDRGEYRLVRRALPPNERLVKWLLGCPEKGYFVPIEGESTDTL